MKKYHFIFFSYLYIYVKLTRFSHEMIRRNFKHKFSKVIEDMPLTKQQRIIIQERYIDIVTLAESQYFLTSLCYLTFTNFITIGGVLVTSFASFDRISDTTNNTSSSTRTISAVFLWIVWVLGLMIAVSSGLLHVFNIPKKYTLNYVILEKLHSEGWLFVAGIGKYEKQLDVDKRFRLFCKRVEKIKLKSVETMPGMDAREESDILAAGSDSEPNSSRYHVQATPRKSKSIFTPMKDPQLDTIIDMGTAIADEIIQITQLRIDDDKTPEEI